MRLELSEAISLILALPAHRSNNEGHRKMGDRALDLLIEYKETEDQTEKAFNYAMICSILSTIRAFSVERDRISGVWASINEIKKRREKYVQIVRNFSPMEKGNYWSKILAIIIAAGFTVKLPLVGTDVESGVWFLIVAILSLEIFSKIFEVILSTIFEKAVPIEKEKKWKTESMQQYRNLVNKFIDEAISNYRKYYPSETELYGHDIKNEDEIKKLKEDMLRIHFYF